MGVENFLKSLESIHNVYCLKVSHQKQEAGSGVPASKVKNFFWKQPIF